VGQIEIAIKVVEILSPDGLRKKRLSKMLSQINKPMAEMCATAGWKPVEIMDDLSISYSGSPYALLSESEKWKTRAMLQFTVASFEDGAEIILIDGADILDKIGRNGLIRASLKSKFRVVIFMTLNEKNELPGSEALEKMNGHSYWIENGVLA